jgi:hypothetical protein
MAGCTAADLVYEVGARRKRLTYLRHRLVEAVTRAEAREHAKQHDNVLAIARRAAAKTSKKKSLVQTAPEVDPETGGPPPVPAGRKSLRVVN